MSKEIPFSLQCYECELGDEIDSELEASAAGWTEIELFDDLMTNYIGRCPACQLRAQGKLPPGE